MDRKDSKIKVTDFWQNAFKEAREMAQEVENNDAQNNTPVYKLFKACTKDSTTLNNFINSLEETILKTEVQLNTEPENNTEESQAASKAAGAGNKEQQAEPLDAYSIKSKNDYIFTPQGKITNALACVCDTKKTKKQSKSLTAAEKEAAVIAVDTNDLEIHKGDFTFKVIDYYSPERLKARTVDGVKYSPEAKRWITRTNKTVLFLQTVFYKCGCPADGIIQCRVEDYAELLGIKNKYKAADELRAHMGLIKHIRVDGADKIGRKEVKTGEIALYGGYWNVSGSGAVGFGFSTPCAKILKHYEKRAAPIPRKLFQTNDKLHPNVFYIGYKFTIHRYMNSDKESYNILSLENIIKDCPFIPNLDEVLESSNRGLYRRILEPVSKALSQLDRIYHIGHGFLCWAKGEKLTDEDYDRLAERTTADDIRNLYVQFDFYNYPENIIRDREKEDKTIKQLDQKEKTKKSKTK